MIAPLSIVAALIGAPLATAQPGTGPTLRIEHGRILQVSLRPPDSGVVAFYADFDVAQPGGAQRMHVLWMTQDQFLPEAGSICTITYRREALLPGNGHHDLVPEDQRDEGPHNVVYGLNCGLAPGQSPPGQRGSPNAR